MAINPSTKYPGQVDTSDPTGYPYGKGKNILVSGDGLGTPWERDIISDIWGLLQSLLSAVSATPSGTPDKVGASQYYDAIAELYSTYTDDAIDEVTLQAAYLRSVAEGVTTPHIDVAGATLAFGGTAGAALLTVNGATGATSALGGLIVEGGAAVTDGSVNVGSGNAIITTDGDISGETLDLVGAANVGGLFTAESDAQFDGDLTVAKSSVVFASAGGGIADGTWTPSVSGVTGNGRDDGDFTALTGHYIRVGNTVMFTIEMVVDTTGWSGAGSVEFDPPIGTASGDATGVVTLESEGTDYFALLTFGTGLSIRLTGGSSLGSGRGVKAQGMITVS